MDDKGLKTLDEIVEEAWAEGYGTREALQSLFHKWRAFGLIGRPIEKQNRRGGAGLWHPVQADLYLFYLGNRRNGINLITLSNAPVGLWLLDNEAGDGQWGIATQQAQRAMLYGTASLLREKVGEPWQYGEISKRGRPKRDFGERSIHAESARRAAQVIARPVSTGRSAISKVLRDVAMETPDFNLPETRYIEAFRAARTQAPRPLAEAVARAQHQSLFDRHLALRHVKALTCEAKPVLELWEWARSFWQWYFFDYVVQLSRLQALPGMGDLFEQPTLEEIMSHGNSYMLGVLGGAIRAVQGDIHASIRQFGLPAVSLKEIGLTIRQDV